MRNCKSTLIIFKVYFATCKFKKFISSIAPLVYILSISMSYLEVLYHAFSIMRLVSCV